MNTNTQEIKERKDNVNERVMEIHNLAHEINKAKKADVNADIKQHTDRLTDIFDRYFINTFINTPYEIEETYLDFERFHYGQMEEAEIGFYQLDNVDEDFELNIYILENDLEYTSQMNIIKGSPYSHKPINMN